MTALRLTTAVLASGGLLLAGGAASAATSAGPGTPVISAAPAHAPTMSKTDGSCSVATPSNERPNAGSDKVLLGVHAHPTGVVALWISGLNAKHCVARRTADGAVAAGRIANAIRHTDAFPTEALPCPFDDGTSVRLYLTYASGGDEYADVSLNGCRPISAPDRASRWGNSPAFEKTLSPIAPKAWQTYLPAAPAAAHGSPVTVTAPTHAPAAATSDGGCSVTAKQPGSGVVGAHNLVWLRSHPSGAVLVWLPGRNAKHCVARRTVETGALASRVVAAVQSAPAEPRGLFCPLDDGSAIGIYTQYASGKDEYARVELTGCATISAPDRGSREDTTKLDRALRSVAPSGWKSELNR